MKLFKIQCFDRIYITQAYDKIGALEKLKNLYKRNGYKEIDFKRDFNKSTKIEVIKQFTQNIF